MSRAQRNGHLAIETTKGDGMPGILKVQPKDIVEPTGEALLAIGVPTTGETTRR